MTTDFPHNQRITQFLIALLTLGVWILVWRATATARSSMLPTAAAATFDTITVHRINVVDPNGQPRLVIANSALFPGAALRGHVYPRSIDNSAGLVFLDDKGEETGGLAFAKLRNQDMVNLTFDYTRQPTDGVSIIKLESNDGIRWRAGLSISDRRPFVGGPIESSQGVARITLVDENQDARLVIADAQGRPRIRIGVDKTGSPAIEMLNEGGKVSYRAAEQANSMGKRVR